MRKNALVIVVTTLVMGIFGAFLRWLQDRTVFEETGLAIPGAAISKVYIVFSLVMLLGMAAVVAGLRRYEKPADASAAFHAATAFPTVLAGICGAAFILAGISLMFSAGEAQIPAAQRLFGAAAVVAGACFPFLPCRKAGETASLGRPAAIFVALFFCFWLALCYLTNAQDPVLWAYVPEILAVMADTVAFYYVAAWFYGRVRPNAAILLLQLAVFLDFCTLPDARGAGMTALFAASAAMLLMTEFLVIENMREKPEESA